jgi:hypothetical protein
LAKPYCIGDHLPYDLAHDRGYFQGVQGSPVEGGKSKRSSRGRLAEVNAMNCPHFDRNRLTVVDKIVAGGTFIAMISIWLPWFSISWGRAPSRSREREHQRDDRTRLALA